MRLTQAQVRQLAEVSEQTFRVWREALPPLGRRSGRGELFTLSDVVAVAAIRSLVNTYGVKIQKLAAVSPELFDACAAATLPGRTAGLLVICGDQVSLGPKPTALHELDAAALVVPLQPIVERVQSMIMSSAADPQAPLPLGPTVVSRAGRRA